MLADAAAMQADRSEHPDSISSRTRDRVLARIRMLGTALLGVLMLLGPSTDALADSGRLFRVLVGFAPGAGTDTLARIYAESLADVLGTSVVVENRPGAGGLIAAQGLKNAASDSNTLMMAVDHQIVLLPQILKNPGFDVDRDFVPIARMTAYFLCLAVHPSSKATDLASFADAVRADNSLGSFGMPAPGSNAQFMGHAIGRRFDVKLNPIAYRGAGPAIADLIGGQVPAAIVPCDAMSEHRKAGRVKILAIAADERLPAMPEVPTIGESGMSGVPSDYFLAVYAPASMKPETLKRVSEATAYVASMPKFVERVAAAGLTPSFAPAEDLRRITRRMTEFWTEQIRDSGFQPN
ncbi:MAG: Twin-arginine translocation pathway signal [Burkholderiaceae bacterium]|nr:Twin-arginine translocation pathway signal [Burkholderiaceae bacterium]